MSNEQTILNPKTDWVFKLMFSKGEEGNKALISFLNAFLEDSYGKINKAEIINTELI
ncbi:PD-(D/E)XK nuclease family transposase, partial [Treponema denticola]